MGNTGIRLILHRPCTCVPFAPSTLAFSVAPQHHSALLSALRVALVRGMASAPRAAQVDNVSQSSLLGKSESKGSVALNKENKPAALAQEEKKPLALSMAKVHTLFQCRRTSYEAAAELAFVRAAGYSIAPIVERTKRVFRRERRQKPFRRMCALLLCCRVSGAQPAACALFTWEKSLRQLTRPPA